MSIASPALPAITVSFNSFVSQCFVLQCFNQKTVWIHSSFSAFEALDNIGKYSHEWNFKNELRTCEKCKIHWVSMLGMLCIKKAKTRAFVELMLMQHGNISWTFFHFYFFLYLISLIIINSFSKLSNFNRENLFILYNASL